MTIMKLKIMIILIQITTLKQKTKIKKIILKMKIIIILTEKKMMKNLIIMKIEQIIKKE